MGNNNLDNLNELFRITQESMHMNFSIGSPDHDFWEYKDMHRFFGYSTAKDDPNLVVGGKQLYEIFLQDYYYRKGNILRRKFPDIHLPSIAAIPADITPDVLLAEGLSRVEVANEVQKISNKFLGYNTDLKLDFMAIMYDYYKRCEGDIVEYYNALMARFFREMSGRWKGSPPWECCVGGLKCYPYSRKTPGYCGENLSNLVSIIESLETYNKMLSNTPGELYYKLDLKYNGLLKNKEFIIEDILNYLHYVDYVGENEDILAPITENLKITQTLFRAQEMREAFYADIIPGIPHYTPEQFLNLCTDAALNLSYAIQKNDLDAELIFENFGYDSRQFSVFRYKERAITPEGDLLPYRNCEGNHELFPEVRAKDVQFHESNVRLIDRANSFISSCEMIKKNQEYIDTHFVGEKLDNLNMAMNRMRHATLHQFLSDLYKIEIYDTMPKKYNRYMYMDSHFNYELPVDKYKYFFR